MSNRQLIAAALALILGVVASVAWFLLGEAAAKREKQEERQPQGIDRPASAEFGARLHGSVLEASEGALLEVPIEGGLDELHGAPAMLPLRSERSFELRRESLKGWIADGSAAGSSANSPDCPCKGAGRG